MKSFLKILACAALGCLAVAAGAATPHASGLGAALPLRIDDLGPLGLVGVGGLIVNGANMRTIYTAFNTAFRGAFTLAKPMWQRVAMEVPSTTSEEEYGWLGMTTRYREWVGERIYQNLKTHGYAIKNKTFESTITVPREKVEDDQYGIFSPLAQQMGQDAALHPDELVFGALLAGMSTLCYDGQYFFDTDHPVGLQGKEVSVSNYGGGSGAAWFLLDTSKVIKPVIFQKRRPYNFVSKTRLDDDNVFDRNEFVFGSDARANVGYGLWQLAYCSKQTLDATSYEAGYTAMAGFKSDSGKPLAIKANIILVGPSNWKKALDVVQAERLANGADNVLRNTTEVVLCSWLP